MPQSDFLGFLHLASCIIPWVAAFVVPLITGVLCYKGFLLGYFLVTAYIMYYGYRMVFPKQVWLVARTFMAGIRRDHLYFDHQLSLLDEGATTDDLKSHSKNLVCFHPHGIFAIGWSLNGCMGPLFQKDDISFIVTGILMRMPIISDILTWYGCSEASKENICARMKTSQNLALLPGGFQEASLYEYGKHRVYIKNRAGFVKYALEHGYRLLPAYTFGEELTFRALGGFMPLRWWLNDYHIPTVFFFGKWSMPLMPFREHDLITVVGRPLVLPTIAAPTNEDVKLWHDKYVEALQELFDRNVKKYAHNPDAKLEIF